MHTELLQNWMYNKRVYVSGASGALGSEICIALQLRIDLELVALRRDKNNTYVDDLQLRDQVETKVPKFLIHCGWDTGDRTLTAQSNSKFETLKLAQYCRENEIRMIFISSQSAVLGTRSNYGAMKFEAEKLVAEHDGTSLRPGLILFDPPAGVQKKLCALSLYGIRIKLYPNVEMTVITVRDFIQFLMNIIDEDALRKSQTAVRNELVSINSLTDSSQHRFCIVIPIPLKLLYFIVRFVGQIRGRVLTFEDSLSAILD